MSAVDKEAQRQQLLLQLIGGDATDTFGWLRADAKHTRGLLAYRANAQALAERALAAAYPVVQQLLGEASFAAMARDFWLQHPPQVGDLGQWGAALPTFLDIAPTLQSEPYLGDVARLEWAVHVAERAADAMPLQGIEQLAAQEPERLVLQLAPGSALIMSSHPVASIWHAHQQPGDDHDVDRFANVRAAFAAGAAENAWVVRQGFRAAVLALQEVDARFVAAVLTGQNLGAALQAAGEGFLFEPWLIQALERRHLVAVQSNPTISASPLP
jgi:Putative DNA-binding domain